MSSGALPPGPVSSGGAQKAADNINVFVWGLPDRWNEVELGRHFKHFGSTTTSRIMRKERPMAKGYGYVTFEDEEGARKAVWGMDKFKTSEGKVLEVTLKAGEEQRIPTLPEFYPAVGELAWDDATGFEGPPGANLTIRNIPEAWGADTLHRHFNHYGTILALTVDKEEKRGLVGFEHASSAYRAIEGMNGFNAGPDATLEVSVREGEEKDLESTAEKVKSIVKAHTVVPRGAGTHIYGLPLSWAEDELMVRFMEYGNIVSLSIVRNADGSSKGQGFVGFDKAESATMAILALHGETIEDRTIRVQLQPDDPNGRDHPSAGPGGFTFAKPPGLVKQGPVVVPAKVPGVPIWRAPVPLNGAPQVFPKVGFQATSQKPLVPGAVAQPKEGGTRVAPAPAPKRGEQAQERPQPGPGPARPTSKGFEPPFQTGGGQAMGSKPGWGSAPPMMTPPPGLPQGPAADGARPRPSTAARCMSRSPRRGRREPDRPGMRRRGESPDDRGRRPAMGPGPGPGPGGPRFGGPRSRSRSRSDRRRRGPSRGSGRYDRDRFGGDRDRFGGRDRLGDRNRVGGDRGHLGGDRDRCSRERSRYRGERNRAEVDRFGRPKGGDRGEVDRFGRPKGGDAPPRGDRGEADRFGRLKGGDLPSRRDSARGGGGKGPEMDRFSRGSSVGRGPEMSRFDRGSSVSRFGPRDALPSRDPHSARDRGDADRFGRPKGDGRGFTGMSGAYPSAASGFGSSRRGPVIGAPNGHGW